MCFIAVAINKDKENIADLFSVINNKSSFNEDGFGLYSLPEINGSAVHTRTKKFDVESLKGLEKSQFLISHLRFSTGGDKSVDNVHLWQSGNWIFCHNGYVLQAKDSKICDSLIFFKILIRTKLLTDNKIKIKKIDKLADEMDLSGRFVLYNVVTKQLYFFGDFRIVLPNVDSNRMYLLSGDVSLEKPIVKYGLLIKDENSKAIESKLDGIWRFDLTRFKFNQISYFTTFNSFKTGYKTETETIGDKFNDDYYERMNDYMLGSDGSYIEKLRSNTQKAEKSLSGFRTI